MTAAADARNALLARKSDERQAAANARESLVRELLRVAEWRTTAGVGAFPQPSQTQSVPSRESLQLYLRPSLDGTFPSLADLVQQHLEATPEPEPEPEPEPDPELEPEPELEPTPVPSPLPIVIPTPVTVTEPSAPSPAVKTEEDDALMDSDAAGEIVDKSEPEEENHTLPVQDITISRGPPPVPPVVPVPMAALVDTPGYSASTPDEDVEMAPSTPPPTTPDAVPESAATPDRPPADPLPFAPPAPAPSQPPSSPQKASSPPAIPTTPPPRRPRSRSFRFDPAKTTNAPRPLSPPGQDTRVPSVDQTRSLLFPPPPTATAAADSTEQPQNVTPVQEVTTTIPITILLPQTPHTPHTYHTPHAYYSCILLTLTTPKPLTTPYAISLPSLPPLPADLSRKVAGVKVRRRGAGAAGSGGVSWGGSGVWGIGTAGTGAGRMGVMGPGGGGAQGWWASISGGQAPPPGTNAAPSSTGMELLRWQAVPQINPAHAFARRPTKCVTTHEWRVLRHELEYTRAMQRIEQLKLDGAWSFRQPKKQRGPVMPKTHWDYPTDEMKWLQVDFREERRWKTALAFEVAHAVRDWHAAPPGSEERKAMCVSYVQPKEEDDVGMEGEVEMEVEVVAEVEAKAGEEEIGPEGKAMEMRFDGDAEGEEDTGVEEVEKVAHTAGPEPREDTMGADEVGAEALEVQAPEEVEGEGDKEKETDEAAVGALTKDWAALPVQEREDVVMAEEDGNDADGEAEVDETVVVATEPVQEADEPKPDEGLPDALEGALRSDADGELTLVPTARNELLELATTASLSTTFTLPSAPETPSTTTTTPVEALADLFPELSLPTGLP
ncbi:chromatin modification- protein VID21, partial [Ceratobasidium sp. 414]